MADVHPVAGDRSRLAAYAWGVLGFNLLVVVWGAFVRASGSGAGCGSHWPLCNGQVVPRPERIETIIELTHRVTSGIALLAVIALLVWSFRLYPRGHRVRTAAVASMTLIVVEALLGAGLVLFELVAQNASVFRAFSMVAHLTNTFLLIGSLTITAWWATGGGPIRRNQPAALVVSLALAGAAMLAVGATGAIAALGDTLFPSGSLAEGFRADLSPAAHFLLRLRLFHPLVAIGTGLYLIILTRVTIRRRPSAAVARFASALAALVVLQLTAGALNLILLAPVWMQLVHLLLADIVWIALVLLAATSLEETVESPPVTAVPGVAATSQT